LFKALLTWKLAPVRIGKARAKKKVIDQIKTMRVIIMTRLALADPTSVCFASEGSPQHKPWEDI
jgi:hypothetical protein